MAALLSDELAKALHEKGAFGDIPLEEIVEVQIHLSCGWPVEIYVRLRPTPERARTLADVPLEDAELTAYRPGEEPDSDVLAGP